MALSSNRLGRRPFKAETWVRVLLCPPFAKWRRRLIFCKGMIYLRYAIGCSVIEKNRKKIDGLYVIGAYGLPYIVCDITNDANCEIRVFDSPEAVKAYIRQLSSAYNLEFSSRAKHLGVDRDCFRFYPIKVDSSKFPFKLSKKPKSVGGKDGIRWRSYTLVK